MKNVPRPIGVSISTLRPAAVLACWLAAMAGAGAAPAVVINEVHYHPVERPAFNSNGAPVLDLSNDVHEFVEIYNTGATNVSLAGWRLTGEVDFEFPTNAVIVGGRYLVVAKNPARLLAIPQYTLNASNVFGPFQNNLGNRAGTVRLRDALDNTVDSVSYSAEFPWAIGADGLGADDEWTGLVSSNFQYRGRSLERVSATWTPNDPANWLASPTNGNPTPARANTVTRAIPRPVVLAQSAYQAGDGARLIRASQQARIDCTFSATNVLSAVQVEYFLDDINSTAETRFTVSMTLTGAASGGRYTALLPGRADRTIVRYRIRANRGGGLETVSPRADDPFAWHAYFVTPQRVSTNRIYDCFISAASLNTLDTNLNAPVPLFSITNSGYRRISLPEPPGTPSRYWNATEPAVFVHDGIVYDARARYHGSQYRRAAANNSWKWQFPRHQLFEGRGGIFISDNDDITVVCGALYRAAGLPQSYTKWFDFYLNSEARITRMDQDEMDDGLVERVFAELRVASPQMPRESSGEFYKSQGNFLFSDPVGPFGYGGYRLLPARPPHWTEVQRYEHTFGLQMNGWKGHTPFRDMLHGLWGARGDTHTAPNPNLPALRAWLAANFDVDATLTSMAIRAWAGGWDNFNHNHFVWRRENGKWVVLQWDFDGELSATGTSIYASERGVPAIYSTFDSLLNGTPWVDANWINDSFFKAFREEYKRKLFILNHTLLNPTNITAMGFGSYRAYADARFASINTQVGLGAFTRPARPTNTAPENFRAALPPSVLRASAYAHAANPRPAHASSTWTIRSASGTFDAPLFKTTLTTNNSTNLTVLPIPFDLLTFGESYYWRCSYTDTNGTPSLDSAETRFVYGGDPSVTPIIALDAGTLWRFNGSINSNPPVTWRNLGFDDSAWPQGAALFADDTGPLPEPIRTPIVRSNRITFYFRKPFVFSGNPSNAALRVRHVINDGIVVYLNGAEILRTGMSSAPVGFSSPANRNVTNAVYEGPFTIVPTNLVEGTNMLAAEVHRTSSVSLEFVFGLTLDAYGPPQPGAIVLNEILADNRVSAPNGPDHPDFIELYNTTAQTQSLNGLSLSDNIANPGKYVFPPGAVIPPNGFLTVWCDDETNAPGLHTGFTLDNDGQTVALFSAAPGGYVLGDSVTFGLQIADWSITRVPDGTGAWSFGIPTPNEAYLDDVTGPPDALVINEWMATEAGNPDWFELYNPTALPVSLGGLLLSDNLLNPTNTVVPPLSFIAPGGFRRFIADEDLAASARHVNFRLSGGGDSIGLFHSYGGAIDTISFGPQIGGVSEGRLPDGSPAIVSFPGTASPEEPNYAALTNILISEVLSHSDPPLEDAIELRNFGPDAADLSGWWLSDSKYARQKFQLPPGSVIASGGHLTFYESQFNPSPGSPGSFGLNSARGDAVFLSAADGLGVLNGGRAEADFGPAENGVTHGVFETSIGPDFVALSAPTFDLPNAYAKVGPVIISEIHYHPVDFSGGADNDRDEFIELRNLAGVPVPLFDPAASTNRWRLRDAVSYTFPPNTTLAPHETILVVGFDPVTNATALAGFRDTHGAVTARIFGPWNGKLDNSSESVELVKPDAPVSVPGPDFGFVPSILVERVRYADSFPWPGAADGTGASLMRALPAAYGNDPTNWFAWVPTPGSTNFYNALPLVALTAPAPGAQFLAPASITLTATASDPDGSIALVEYFDGANKIGSATTPPYTVVWNGAAFGPHTLTARARDNGNASDLSAPVDIVVVSLPPAVALTAPANNALFIAGNSVPLAATATDPDTPVALVEFFVDGAKVAEDSVPPYAASWTATAGYHSLTAVATDITATRGTSAPVRVFAQAVSVTESVLVASNSVWRYHDQGIDLGAAWTNLNFAENTWSNGVAELGYGDSGTPDFRPETTVISFGPSSANKHPTYYFRQKFVLSSLADITNATLSIVRDDGARAFLNGVEVYRNNLPVGTVTYATLAPLAIANADEALFIPTNVSPAHLVVGTNILAIEIHQQSAGSSDVSFNAELRVTRLALGPAITAAPQPRIANVGENVTFSVTAIGTPVLGYQWRRNGAILPGQTAAALALNNVQPADAGGYSVTVSNAAGVVTSLPAPLAVGTSDYDGDGLPDAWEIAHGLDPLDAADRLLDSDGDRLNNEGEFLAGTDPTNALSVLKIDSLAFGRGMVLSFNPKVENASFTVEYTDALGTPWAPLATLPPVAGTPVRRFADTVAPGGRFYRLHTGAVLPDDLRIGNVTTGPAAVLTFQAVAGRSYTIEYTDNPGTLPWQPLFTLPAQPVSRTATVADPATTPARAYRLAVP